MDSLCNRAGLKGTPPAPPAPFVQPESGHDPLDYLRGGHFTAAVARTSELIPHAPNEHTALSLWYVRIQSLLFLQLGRQVAEEANACLGPLEQKEFLASLPDSSTRLVAWKLRLVLAPVRSKGINHAAVQLYYGLGAEARAHAVEINKTTGEDQLHSEDKEPATKGENVTSAEDGSEVADIEADGAHIGGDKNAKSAKSDESDAEDTAGPWLAALRLAGLFTVAALIAMRDYMTAVNLLDIHYRAEPRGETARLLALIYIHVGDTLSAREWVARLSNDADASKLKALYNFADADSSENILPVISEVYGGRVGEAIKQLETQIVSSESSVAMHTDVTNLFVLYDLCYADARARRAQVAERLVANGKTSLESTELSNEFRRAVEDT